MGTKTITNSLFLLCFLHMLQLSVTKFGFCKSVKPLKDLDFKRFAGRWYEYYSFYGTPDHFKCRSMNITLKENNKLHIMLEQTNEWKIVQEYYYLNATITRPAEIFLDQTFESDEIQHYSVLGTDYENFAVIYGCIQFFFRYQDSLYVVTRERKPNPEIFLEARDVILKNGLPLKEVLKANQRDCTYGRPHLFEKPIRNY